MSPQVLPLRLAGYPPRDAAGVAEAWEGTKALRACQKPSAEAVSGELNKKNVLHWNEVWVKRSVETELFREG